MNSHKYRNAYGYISKRGKATCAKITAEDNAENKHYVNDRIRIEFTEMIKTMIKSKLVVGVRKKEYGSGQVMIRMKTRAEGGSSNRVGTEVTVKARAETVVGL